MANSKQNHALILSALFSNHFNEFATQHDIEENCKAEIVSIPGMGTNSLAQRFTNGPRDLSTYLQNIGATILYFEDDQVTEFRTEEGDVIASIDDVLLEIRYHLFGDGDYRNGDNLLFIKATVAEDQRMLTLMATERIQELLTDFTDHKMREILGRIQRYQGKKFNNELLIDSHELMQTMGDATRVEQQALGSVEENGAAVAHLNNMHHLMVALQSASMASMYNIASILAPNVVKVSYDDVSESEAFKDVGSIHYELSDGSVLTLSGDEIELGRDDFMSFLVDNNNDYYFVENEHADDADKRLLEQLSAQFGSLSHQDVIKCHEIIRELCYQEENSEFYLPSRTLHM